MKYFLFHKIIMNEIILKIKTRIQFIKQLNEVIRDFKNHNNKYLELSNKFIINVEDNKRILFDEIRDLENEYKKIYYSIDERPIIYINPMFVDSIDDIKKCNGKIIADLTIKKCNYNGKELFEKLKYKMFNKENIFILNNGVYIKYIIDLTNLIDKEGLKELLLVSKLNNGKFTIDTSKLYNISFLKIFKYYSIKYMTNNVFNRDILEIINCYYRNDNYIDNIFLLNDYIKNIMSNVFKLKNLVSECFFDFVFEINKINEINDNKLSIKISDKTGYVYNFDYELMDVINEVIEIYGINEIIFNKKEIDQSLQDRVRSNIIINNVIFN